LVIGTSCAQREKGEEKGGESSLLTSINETYQESVLACRGRRGRQTFPGLGKESPKEVSSRLSNKKDKRTGSERCRGQKRTE